MYQALADMACNRITAGITARFVGERPIKAVLDPFNPVGSTAHVRFNTSRTFRVRDRDHHLMYGWCIRGGPAMRTTFNLDDRLLGEAQRLTGMTERTALIHEGLRALIQRESARRLARLGASEPSLRVVPRRRAGRVKSR